MSKAERLYEPYRKHPALFGDVFLESWLHPDMLELVKAFEKQQDNEDDETTTPTSDDAMSKISPYLRLESEGVYSFPCLSNSFIQIFNEELQNFYTTSEKCHWSLNSSIASLSRISIRLPLEAYYHSDHNFINPSTRLLTD
jgi:hypothetical protein